MNFFINKKATLPVIKMELINDGRNDYNHFMELVQNSNIFFCMTDIENGIPKVAMQPASCERKESSCDGNYDCEDHYYLVYRWDERDTKIPGTYKGEFTIDINADLKIVSPCSCDEKVIGEIQHSSIILPGGRLIVPIRDELFIHVLDGSIKK